MTSKYEYDAFISHAVEDKIPIANELCTRLEAEGLTIWYSGKELNAGDSIANSIHEGLNKSRFGIVILSKNYIAKNWPLREFYLLLARESEGNKVILPVLFEITPQDLALKDLTMADRFGIKADNGLDFVVSKLMDVIKTSAVVRKKSNRKNYLVASILAIVLSGTGVLSWTFLRNDHKPSQEMIQREIHARKDALLKKIEKEYLHTVKKSGAMLSSVEIVDSIYRAFRNQKSYYRNEYEFYNGVQSIRSKKNVEAALQMDVDNLNPINEYNLRLPQFYVNRQTAKATYFIFNTQPLEYSTLDEQRINDSTYTIKVQYQNNVRYIQVDLQFSHSSSDTKRHQMFLVGFLPEESLIFKRRNQRWMLANMREPRK